MQSPTDTPFVLQNEEQRAHTLNIIRQSKVMPVLGKDQLEIDNLEKILADYPITLHGVGMSLGSTDPLNQSYLKKLKTQLT